MRIPTFEQSVIAVVGVAKNCGKTTTLNALVGASREAGRRIGLTSIGIDGETRDALLGTPKPPILVEPGDLFATTRQLIASAPVEVEFVEPLGFSTPLGESVIVRAHASGRAMIGGLRHRADVAACVRHMRRHGANQVWIDGAYGRVSAADPELCDGVVVATGAVVSPDVGELAQITRELAERLSGREPTVPWQRTLIAESLRQERALLGGPTLSPIELPAKSALLGLRDGRQLWSEEVEGIAIPGVVSDSVLLELLRVREAGVLVVRDGTCLQADGPLLTKLGSRWEVLVSKACALLAVSFNPTSVQGHQVDRAELTRSLRAEFPNITVFDPIVGIH